MSWYAESEFEKAVKEVIRGKRIRSGDLYSILIDVSGTWITADLRWQATINFVMARGILNDIFLNSDPMEEHDILIDIEPILNRAGWTKYTPTSTVRCRYCHEVWGYDYIDPHMSVCPHRLDQMACYSCGHYIPHGQCEISRNWHMIIGCSHHSNRRND